MNPTLPLSAAPVAVQPDAHALSAGLPDCSEDPAADRAASNDGPLDDAEFEALQRLAARAIRHRQMQLLDPLGRELALETTVTEEPEPHDVCPVCGTIHYRTLTEPYDPLNHCSTCMRAAYIAKIQAGEAEPYTPRPDGANEPFCACGRRVSQCDGSRAGCCKRNSRVQE